MLKLKTFKINSIFEVFFFKKLIELLLLVCQDVLSVHVQVLVTKSSLRVFAFVLNKFADLKLTRKLVSNKTTKLFQAPHKTVFAKHEQESLVTFEQQGSLEEFTSNIMLKNGGIEPTKEELAKWIDPVRYQPTFSRARTYLKDFYGEYYMENLPPVDLENDKNSAYNPRYDKTLIHRSDKRKVLTNTGFIEFYIKKIYSFICVKNPRNHIPTKSCYKKKFFKLKGISINSLKRLTREIFDYPPLVVYNPFMFTSKFLKTNKVFTVLFDTKLLKRSCTDTKSLGSILGLGHHVKEISLKLNRVESYINKVLHNTYVSWYLTKKNTSKLNLKNYSFIYDYSYKILRHWVGPKIKFIVQVQSIYSRLLKFIYKKEFTRLIRKSLVDKTLCYYYVHRLLLALLLLDLSLIVNFIALRIHKTKKTKRLQKQMLNLFKRIFYEFRRHMSLHFVGFYFQIKGKLKGKRRKSRWLFKIGAFPLTQDTLEYSYSYSQAVSRFGAYGVRCQLITKKQ